MREISLKLLNLNLGIKLDNSKDVIKLIKEEQCDIVAFQEVMRKKDDSVFDRYDSSNVIKANTNFKYSYFGPLWYAKHHIKNNVIKRDFGGMTEQGNEILSRFPIIKANNIFYYKEYLEFSDTTNFRIEDHPRAFIDAILDIEGTKLQIINIHGCWNKDKKDDDRTIFQTEKILSHIRYDIPSIVVGDFNLLPNTKSIEMIAKKMINLIEKYNIKSTRPKFDDGLDKGNLVCDYIFVNDKVKVNDFRVIDTNISDHLPLILDFSI